MNTLNKSLAGTGFLLLGFAALMDFRPWLALFMLTGAGMFFLSSARGVLRKK